MKTGVPELKYQNDYGNNMLTLRRPACQSHQKLELSCKPCSQTDKAMLIQFQRNFLGWGKQAKNVQLLFWGHIMCPLLISWLHRAETKREQHFVIQYYKYEKISQAFQISSKNPSSTRIMELVIGWRKSLTSFF